MEQPCSYWTDFDEICCLSFLRKAVEKIQMSQKSSSNNNGYFTESPQGRSAARGMPVNSAQHSAGGEQTAGADRLYDSCVQLFPNCDFKMLRVCFIVCKQVFCNLFIYHAAFHFLR
jgi:hypothetical protein